jgi:hypothetical protein
MTAEQLAEDHRFKAATYGLVRFGLEPTVDLESFAPRGVVMEAIVLLRAAARWEAREGEAFRRMVAVADAIFPDPDCDPASN